MSSPHFTVSDEPQLFTIQFSPTIDRQDDIDEEEEEEETPQVMTVQSESNQPDEELEEDNLEQEGEEEEEANYKLNETVKFTLNNSSCSSADIDDTTRLESLLGTPKHDSKLVSQSIESIHRTEACVFYVLSQLSHGDKPSIHLFTNFDTILTCLLEYLKNAPVRNPRALRILNRLTKNTPGCQRGRGRGEGNECVSEFE